MGKKITAQAVGGDAQHFDEVNTVAELKAAMDLPTYTATINGNPAKDSDLIPDYGFVALAAPVKGGC